MMPNTSLKSLSRTPQKHLPLSRIVLGVFTAPLHSNGRGVDHIETGLSIVEACLLQARVYQVVA
jgi:hypothetical protein